MQYKDIPLLRNQLYEEQNQLCGLCKQEIDINEICLDHNHSTGKIRMVLHRGCNAFLGHIENSRTRNRISDIKLANILANLTNYISSSREEIHPLHTKKKKKKVRRNSPAL